MKGSLALTARGEHSGGTPAGLTIAAGSVAIVAAALVAAIAPPADSLWRLGVMVVVIAAFAAFSRQASAMFALVPLAWLVVNGFLVDRYGVLTWHGTADVYRLLVLIVAAFAGLGIAGARSRRG